MLVSFWPYFDLNYGGLELRLHVSAWVGLHLIEYRDVRRVRGSGEKGSSLDAAVKKILVIDDERIVRSSVCAYLEDLDYIPLEASNGISGLELIEIEKPDLVLLDLQMPEMGGLEVLSHIQSSTSVLPVIVISGGGVIGDVVEALRLGAWDYLTKPIPDLVVLQHAMEKVLERARLINEHNRYQTSLEHEIAERKLVERSLRESEVRFRDMVESSSDWVWEMDVNFRFSFLSHQFFDISGFQQDDFIGRTREESLAGNHSETTDSQVANLHRMLEQHQTFKMFEYEIVRKDGSRLVMRISGKPVFDEGEEFVGYRGTGFDISGLRDTQEQLQHAEKMAALGGLVAGIAHEINTPVGIGVTAVSHISDTVRDFSRSFSRDEASHEDLEEFLSETDEICTVVMSNLERAADLIQSFKQVAVDQSSENRRSFDLGEYIDEVLLSLHPRIKKTSHHVIVTCPEPITMDSFPGAISQMLTNLVMNSLIHGFEGQEGGKISMDITEEAGQVVLNYVDTGRGMDEEQLGHLFEPFYTTKRGTGGSGLGMNIVFNLVNNTLGGTISCRSSIGEGTSFTISMPVVR